MSFFSGYLQDCLFIFGFQQFDYNVSRYAVYIFYILLRAQWTYWTGKCMSLTKFGEFSAMFFNIFFLAHSLISFLKYSTLWYWSIGAQGSDHLLLFFLCFSDYIIYIGISLSSDSLFGHTHAVVSPCSTFFILCMLFFSFIISIYSL